MINLHGCGSLAICVLRWVATQYSFWSVLSYYKHALKSDVWGTAHNFRAMQFLTPITVMGGLAGQNCPVPAAGQADDDLELGPHMGKPPALPDVGWTEILDWNDQLHGCQANIVGSNQIPNESTPLTLLASGWLHLPSALLTHRWQHSCLSSPYAFFIFLSRMLCPELHSPSLTSGPTSISCGPCGFQWLKFSLFLNSPLC
jgi:hypothetical protein